MNTTLWTDLLQSPCMRNLVLRIVDGLSNQVSQLLLVPQIVERNVVYNAIRAEALERDFSIIDVCFSSGDAELTPSRFVQLLQRKATGDCSKNVSFEDLLRDPNLPELVFLIGTEHLSHASRQFIVDILSQWSRISQNVLERGESCATACCIAFADKGVRDAAQAEVHLNIEWWWGLPSTLEAALLCRQWTGEDGRDAKNVWSEALATSLCPGDVTYIGEIWSVLSKTHSMIWQKTREYGENLGWTRSHVQQVCGFLSLELADFPDHDSKSMRISTFPPAEFRTAWAAGMLLFSPESGCELHPAALALAGRIEALEQRLWRAQATLLLPRLDMIRHNICGQLAQRYGIDWAMRWSRPRSDEEIEQLTRSHFACQWGYLEYLLRSCPAFRAERRAAPMVTLCREIRNELAHYRPISFERFQQIWRHLSPWG